jgi:hypothetical protein
MTKKYIVKTTEDYRDLQDHVNRVLYNHVVKNLDFKPFEVTIEEYKKRKSYKQLQGFYRIARNLIPYFGEWTQEHWNEEKLKEFFKKRYGYVTNFKGVTLCKSFKDASMDDLIGVIKEMQKFGDEMDLPKEITELKSEDQRVMEEFYGINK